MEEAWELAVVSRASDLHDLLSGLKNYGMKVSGNNSVSVVRDYAKSTGIGNTFSDFVELYLRLIDAAIDEALSTPNLQIERRENLVLKLSRARNFTDYASSGKSWNDSLGNFVTDDFLDILDLVNDAVSSANSDERFDKNKSEMYYTEIQKIYDSILESDLAISIKAPILSNLWRLLEIFELLEKIGPLDADLRMKAILGDLIINGEEIQNSSEEAKRALTPLLAFVKRHYPSFKWTVDHLMTAANVGLLAVQTGVAQ